MTFTRRIRWCLILIAILPPLVIMSLTYVQLVDQSDLSTRRQANLALQKYRQFRLTFDLGLEHSSAELTSSPAMQRVVRQLSADRSEPRLPDPKINGFDFLEIADTTLVVRATWHRPGLIGELLRAGKTLMHNSSRTISETTEYDRAGAHASIVITRPLERGLLAYAGRYMDQNIQRQIGELMGNELSLTFLSDSSVIYSAMIPGSLYQTASGYQAVLAGSDSAGFYLTTRFDDSAENPALVSLLGLTGLVALASILAAVGVGLFITGRAKREINNLVTATERIAKGDLSTPIMAYEEGEFSVLADSFSDMIVKLKKLQRDLASSEKTAAWQSMGRKIAHEVRNPLTPIAISADDLRRSYLEKQPEFDKILNQATTTIKSEVDRLTRLLDQFVKFARMAPPVMKSVNIALLGSELESLYRREIEIDRLRLSVEAEPETFSLDPDAIKQLIINLVKNGLEAGEDTKVLVSIARSTLGLAVTVEDNGPGFSEEKLTSSIEPQISSKRDGSGLGLVICHRIVKDHGGELELYNHEKGGAGVRVTVPE